MSAPKVPKISRILPKNLVGPRVREARKAYPGGLTQDQLSGRLAALTVTIDRPGIAKIELGIRQVYDTELAALAQALKVDVRWLLGMQDSGGPANGEGRRR